MTPFSALAAALALVALTTAPLFAALRDVVENHLGMRFVRVPAGELVMGTRDPVAARMEIPDPDPQAVMDETPAHTVVISKGFYLGETEVTQPQLRRRTAAGGHEAA